MNSREKRSAEDHGKFFVVRWGNLVLLRHATMDTAEVWHIHLNVEKLLGRAEKHSTSPRTEKGENQRARQRRLGF